MVSQKKLIFLVWVFALCTAAPATAGTKYMAGSPELSASIAGTNELSPGDTVELTVVIENTGLNEFKFVQPGIVDREDQPNTAKFLTVSLDAGDAPIVIKSDPRMLGDLTGAGSAHAVFTTKIRSDAPAGTYLLPLSLDYAYLYQAEQFGVDTIQYFYKTKNETLLIPIKIRSELSIDVISAVPEHLNAGSDGYIILKIKNTGCEDGSKAVVKIIRSGESPVIPADDSVYIGDFPPGSIVECRYKVSVSPDAERQTYPVDVVVIYQNTEGDFITSGIDTVGIPVAGKVEFSIISPPAVMNPGNKKVVTVEYKNSGDTTIYSAHARISAVDPFTSNDDTAYIGDLNPGESRTASFMVSVDRTATIKEFGLDSEIRYRDALDNTYISDTMKVRINIIAPTGVMTVLSSPIYLSVILAGVSGVAYLVYHYRRKINF